MSGNNRGQLTYKMRKHNFQLGNPSDNMANSTYDTAYVPYGNESFNAPNTEELKKKVIALRNTNLVLGQDPNNDVSVMRADYQKISGFEPVKLNRAQLQKTHFTMGSENPELTSINRTFYKAHKHDPNSSNDKEKIALMEDLRSTEK